MKTYPSVSLKLLNLDDLLPQVQYDSHADRLRLTGLYVIAIHSLDNN